MSGNEPMRQDAHSYRNVYDAAMQAAQVGSMEARLDALGVKVDELGRRMDKRFEQMDRRFEEVDRRFERVEAELRAQHREFTDRFDRLQRLMIQFSGGAIITLVAALVAGS